MIWIIDWVDQTVLHWIIMGFALCNDYWVGAFKYHFNSHHTTRKFGAEITLKSGKISIQIFSFDTTHHRLPRLELPSVHGLSSSTRVV